MNKFAKKVAKAKMFKLIKIYKLPSSRSVNRPIGWNFANVSMQIRFEVLNRAIHTWSCFTNLKIISFD